MEKGKLYFTVGLSRSGKSSWAEKWKYNHPETAQYGSNRPRVVISGDGLRKAIHGGEFRIEAEPIVFCNTDIFTRMLLNTGYDVLIDETCTTEQTLLRYLRLDMEAKPIFFNASEAECIKRAIDTGKPFLIPPITRMAKQLKVLLSNWDETVIKLKSYLEERKMHDVAV
jgi:hypothetical protein